VAEGALVLHPPRLWPEYSVTYFAAFVRDPDGNNIEAVCHLSE
jgi:catechol 2,3-dioxygenase-like lactoylglutathione lyase family enzyme